MSDTTGAVHVETGTGAVRLIKTVPVDKIRISKTAMREAERTEEQFKELVASIARDGILKTILVREVYDVELNDNVLILIDGAQRLAAAKELGMPTVNVGITDADEYNAIRLQLIANTQGVTTKPAQMAKQIQRMIDMEPYKTKSQLAAELGHSTAFIDERLKLLKLSAKVGRLVDDGKITLANAAALTALPVERQEDLIVEAQTTEAAKFLPKCHEIARECAKAKREGRAANPVGFVSVPRLRSPAEIKAEFAHNTLAETILSQNGAATAVEGWKAAIAWVLNSDPLTVAQDKAKYEADKRAKEEAAARRKSEAEEKKRKEAANEATA